MSVESLLKDSIFVSRWIESNVRNFKRLYPMAKEKDLRTILSDVVQEHIKNPRCMIYNNYQDDRKLSSTLLEVYDWKVKAKPICGGSGTFFVNQNKVNTPIAKVIDGRITARKQYQKTRDEYISDTNSYEYQYFDMMQKEAKIKINAIYGSFGAKTFQLYNPLIAAATTATAQSLISTTAIAFEAFLSDNVKFRTIDEFITYIDYILMEDYKVDLDVVITIDDPDIVFERLWNHFLVKDLQIEEHKNIMKTVLSNCTPEELTKIYYKNNLYAFANCPIILSILKEIFDSGVIFRDPNKTPNELESILNELWEYTNAFVFYNHAYTERINRLINHRRDSVIVVDTDSNMIHIEPWIDFLKDNMWNSNSCPLSEDDKLYTSVNVLAFLVTKMVRSLLDTYCDNCNILPNIAKRINMKNEFCYEKMLLAPAKKRYAARTILKEGKEVKPGSKGELDVKGYDFRKAGVSEEISTKLYDILLKSIMRPKELDIGKILSQIDYIEHEIRTSLQHGERTYLLRMNCKNPIAYANPESMGAVQSVDLWNAMYPYNEITVPDKLDVVLLKEVKEKDLELQKEKYPEEIRRITEYIFYGPSGERYRKNGLKYLALPNNGDPIPDVILPYIDIDRIVTRNLGTFEPVMVALGLPYLTSGSDYKYFGTVLDI